MSFDITRNGLNTDEVKEIYKGKRGDDFKNLIKGIIKKGKLKDEYVDLLISEKAMKEYNKAFTHKSADPFNNYENYEQLGDALYGHFIVYYYYRRYPQLLCPNGVKVVAKAKTKFGSKQVFSKIALKLGFWDYITVSFDERNSNRESILEDVFESFIGCTEALLNKQFNLIIGYSLIYDILENICNEIDMPCQYSLLENFITILKEIGDKKEGGLDKIDYRYETVITKDKYNRIRAIVTATINGIKLDIGKGESSTKDKSKEAASEDAVNFLKNNYRIVHKPKIEDDNVCNFANIKI